MLGKVVFWCLCVLLLVVPLPVGLTEEWAIFVFEAAVVMLFVVYVINKTLVSKHENRVIKKEEEKEEGEEEKEEQPPPPQQQKKKKKEQDLFPLSLKILLLIFLVVSLLQLVPIPSFLLRVISPGTHDVYSRIFSGGFLELGSLGWKTLSLAPGLSGAVLIQYVAVFLFAFLVLQCVRTKKEAEILVLVLIASALFQTFYGLTEYFGGTERILGYTKEWGRGSATGTFINRNHFAGFLEMIFPVGLGYLLVKADFFAMKKGLSIRERLLWFGQERLQRCIVFGAVAVMIGIGLLFSRSRSGVFIFLVTVFLMILVLTFGGGIEPGRKEAKKRLARIVRLVFFITLFAVILIGIRPIIERFSMVDLSREGRLTYFKNTLELIKTYPLFGTGLGTYVDSYEMFEKIDDKSLAMHAHDDYLEFAAESGLIGAGCLIGFAFGGLGVIFVRWGRRRDYFAKGIGLGCMLGITAILIHSASDFNLHIPANAIYFSTLYALAFRLSA